MANIKGAPAAEHGTSSGRLSEADMTRFRGRMTEAKDKKLGEEIEAELAAVMSLAEWIHQARKIAIPGVAARIDLIIDCLLMDKPRLAIAREQRSRLQLATYQGGWRILKLFAWLATSNSIGVVFVAPLVSLVVLAVAMVGVNVLYNHVPMARDAFFMNSQALVVMTSAAYVGGVVSIAMRWREFALAHEVYPLARFVTLMFRPLIGVALAVFILAMVKSELVTFAFLNKEGLASIDLQQFKDYYAHPTTPVPDSIAPAYKTLYILWVLGFLSGFSERVGSSLVDRAEGLLISGRKGKGKRATNTD